MIELPISQAQAARSLGLDPRDASIAVRLLDIPTEPSPLNGNAHMLDAAGFNLLRQAAIKLGRKPLVAAQ